MILCYPFSTHLDKTPNYSLCSWQKVLRKTQAFPKSLIFHLKRTSTGKYTLDAFSVEISSTRINSNAQTHPFAQFPLFANLSQLSELKRKSYQLETMYTFNSEANFKRKFTVSSLPIISCYMYPPFSTSYFHPSRSFLLFPYTANCVLTAIFKRNIY